MLTGEFKDLVESMQAQSNALHAKAQRVLGRALPENEGLRSPNKTYTPRVLQLLHTKAAGRLPKRDYEALGTAITVLDETRDRSVRWLLWVQNGRDVGYLGQPLEVGQEPLDLASELVTVREALDRVGRSSSALDEVLGQSEHD